MAKIQLTPDELRSQAAGMDSLRAEYEALFAEVTEILKTTNDNWSEALSRNFAGKIILTQRSFTGIVDILSFGANAARTSADGFETVDAALSKALLGWTEVQTGIFAAEPGEADLEDPYSETIGLMEILAGFGDDVMELEGFDLLKACMALIRSMLGHAADIKDPEAALDVVISMLGFGGVLAGSNVVSVSSKVLNVLKEDIFSIPDSLHWYEQLQNMDDVISAAGKLGGKAAKVFKLVKGGVAGIFETQEALGIIVPAFTMLTHLVGKAGETLSDGRISADELADLPLDVGAAGGASMIRGLTLGIIDIDTQSAVNAYKAGSEEWAKLWSQTGLPLWAQCSIDVLGAPYVFLNTTANLINDAVNKRIGQINAVKEKMEHWLFRK